MAVMTSTSGAVPSRFLSRRAALCSTPNRCCSSITTTPREPNSTPSWMMAWVPMSTSTPPASSSLPIRRRSPAVVLLVNRSTFRGRWPSRVAGSDTVIASSRPAMVVWCCSASTSVGTMTAAWCPPCTATSIAATATTVFPEPTSPWRSRCMGADLARSARISSTTRSWAVVIWNPSPERNSSRSAVAPTSCAMPTEVRSRSTLRWTRANWMRRSSSNTRRRRASPISWSDPGRWMAR